MEQADVAQDRLPLIERLETPRSVRLANTSEEQSVSDATIKLSVVMAAHNEVGTLGEAISSVLSLDVKFELELIVVDDGSTDGSDAVIDAFDDPRLIVLRSPRRRGKGAALLSAASAASGTHLLVFDADLEYSADDIPSLVEPVARGFASVVYGTRVPGMRTAFRSFRYALGSKITTIAANLMFDAWMTDMHTCLKLMPLRTFRELSLTQLGFGLDTEITAELLRRGVRPYEVPCSYRGRSVAQGKKISPRDGLSCLAVLARVRLRGVIPQDLASRYGASLETLRVLPREETRPSALPRPVLPELEALPKSEAATVAGRRSLLRGSRSAALSCSSVRLQAR